MLAAGVATWRVWLQHGGPMPVAMAGHSLGEYTALVCSQALDFRVAVDLVRFRGQAMQRAVPLGEGAMAAVLGLDDAELAAACQEAAQGQVVEPVNFNAPGQVVIAGHAAAVARAIDAAKLRGAKRAMALPVSVPSHSSLMIGAADQLAERLLTVDLAVPAVPAVYTVDVQTHQSPDGIRRALREQLFKPVRWADTVRAMIASGVTTFVECGPGRVLDLARQAHRAATRTADAGHRRSGFACSRTDRGTGDSSMLENEVALVTGASRGIGRAIALELGRRGARVVGTATTEQGAASIGEALAAAGIQGRGVVLDVSSDSSVEQCFKDIEAREGTPTVLVNNAGITHDGLLMRMSADRLAVGDRDGPLVRLPDLQGGHARHDEGAAWPHHQHRVGRGGDGQRRPDKLFGREGRHDRLLEEPGAGRSARGASPSTWWRPGSSSPT